MDLSKSIPSESDALVRKRTDTDLMPPPPPAKKVKRPRKVLDEDTYTESLSQIIARDYFPGLLETEIKHEYLDAVESKDDAWIASATKRLHLVMTPGRPESSKTLQQNLTPITSLSSPLIKPAVDTSMSLGAFQATYTSEDNESFYKLIDRQNQKKADKYAWIWRGNRLPSKRELKQLEVEARRGTDGLLTSAGEEGRPAMADTWKFNPKNQLMFLPDSPDEVRTLAAEQARSTPSLVYANTRLPDNAKVETERRTSSAPPSPTLSRVRDAIAGHARSEYADSSTGGGSETPRVNGYAYVDDEEPEETTPVKFQINLGPVDGACNPFEIRENSKREALHRRMVEKIAESKRSSRRLGMTGKERRTPTPKYPASPRVTGNLTPAAQRLWSNIRPGSGTPSRTSSRTSSKGQTPTPLRPSIGHKP